MHTFYCYYLYNFKIIIAVQNICVQNRSTLLEDIVKLVSTQTENIQQEAYEIYVQYLIESGYIFINFIFNK